MRLVVQKIYKGKVAAEYNMTVNNVEEYAAQLEQFDIFLDQEHINYDICKDVVTLQIPLVTGDYDEQAQ